MVYLVLRFRLEEAGDGIDNEGRKVKDHSRCDKRLDGPVGLVLKHAQLLIGELWGCKSSEHDANIL